MLRSYDALVGVDDMTPGLGKVRFSVYGPTGSGCGGPGRCAGGDPAVPVHVVLSGRETVRLVVEPHGRRGTLALADWAESRFTCG